MGIKKESTYLTGMGPFNRPNLLRCTGGFRRRPSKKCHVVGNTKLRDLICRSAAPCAWRCSKDRVVPLSQSFFSPHSACVQVAQKLQYVQPDRRASLSSHGSEGEIKPSKDLMI